MKEQLYAINLEDYSSIRYAPTVRTYIGTKQDMLNLASYIEQFNRAGAYYSETINAIRSYDEHPDGEHTQCGKKYPIFSSAKEVARKEFFLEDHEWTYTTAKGVRIPIRANQVWVSQMVVKVTDALVRCSKAVFENIGVCHSGIGWVNINDNFNGFPGMVYFEPYGIKAEGEQHMTLYIAQKRYQTDELQIAIDDMRGPLTYDMTDVTRDILGNG